MTNRPGSRLATLVVLALVGAGMGALLWLLFGPRLVGAQQVYPLEPDTSVTVECSTEATGTYGPRAVRVDCGPLPATPAPTPVPETIGGVPVCPGHDPMRWHPLAERDTRGRIVCTHGHHHGDDPAALDGLFGPIGAQSISYPWQTSSSLGAENEAKHRVYVWQVVTPDDLGGRCVAADAEYGLSAFRAQFHADGELTGGPTVRFHSFSFEGETCDPANPDARGYIRLGGHIDYGILSLHLGGGVYATVPLPADPTGYTPSSRIHGSPTGYRGDSTWYGRLAGPPTDEDSPARVDFGVGLRQEAWGAVDPAAPSRIHWYGGGANGSWQEPGHLIELSVWPWTPSYDRATGTVTYEGWADRYGSIRTDCAVPAANCVPLSLHNVKVGRYQFRTEHAGLGVREYDEVGPSGESLIKGAG